VPDSPTNNMVLTALIEQLPTRDASTVHEYFLSAVAITRKNEGHRTVDQIYKYTDDDF
jgi:hypothetical protein